METVNALARCGSTRLAGEELRMPQATVQSRVNTANRRGIKPTVETDKNKPPTQEFKQEGGGDTQYISSVDHDVRTVEDALKKAEVDLSIWEVDRFLVNSWEQVSSEHGRQPLWQVKVWLKRIVAKAIEDSAKEIALRMRKHAPKYPKLKYAKVTDPHMLEVSVFDLHLAKYCWAAETGDDYDIGLAESLFLRAITDILAKTTEFPIDKVLFPVGNDFFHVDNVLGTTTAGTQQDFDSRYQKMYVTGCMACVKAIELLAGLANVHCIWVPGNHDATASMHLALWLESWFRHSKNVTFDNSPKENKYVLYGEQFKTVLGFTHGDGTKRKRDNLPLTMAGECEDWSRADHREIHLGHFHQMQETCYEQGKTQGPVRVRILPSLSGTDKWHYKQGFIHHYRAAEAYLWSARTGYVGHFSSNVG